MKRTTISLPEDLSTAVEREAQRCGISISEVTRRALAAYFDLQSPEPRRLPFTALGRSGQRDTARRVEEILAEEWEQRE
ncbi:MAG: CopG family transcriptional regulator [Armatimonadetes bacterium]|nr:CopG family transcriptional regulator [Armatimonadota bacterium]